jgi:hypothetical protein
MLLHSKGIFDTLVSNFATAKAINCNYQSNQQGFFPMIALFLYKFCLTAQANFSKRLHLYIF